MASQPLRSARQWGSSHLSVVTQRVNGFTPPQQLLGRSQITGRLIEPDEESTRSPGTHAVHSVRQARQAEARALLDETLGLSLAARSTRSVTLCLAALARWAPVAGAAEGLRRRAGLRVWPMLRQGEADLVAQVRQALGTDHFDQVFATGTRLTQRDAVAAARAGTAPVPG
jgi:hypothetical protein